MSEWSSRGYYSGSAAREPQPHSRGHRQSWEENWDQGNIGNWNINCYKMYQQKIPDAPQYTNEDIGIPPTYSSSKKKRNGGPDPRFRRVINPEYRSEADMETEKLGSKGYELTQDDSTAEDKVVSFLKIPNNVSYFPSSKAENATAMGNHKDLSNEVTKDTGFQKPNQYYRNCGVMFPCDNVQEFKPAKEKPTSLANLKRSASDCTLNKKRTFADENVEEVSEKVRPYPSATRLAKVHNWMKDYNIFPEKRRSVITVIGQTQTKPFSKILSEINQRRKLAKELDRHALCEAIMESAEGQTDVKNLVAKVDLVLPDGKVIYSTEKVYLRRDNKLTDAGVYSHQSMEALDAYDQKKKIFQMIPERDSSVSQFGKRNKTRKSNKKTVSPIKEKLREKGSIRGFCDYFTSVRVWLILTVLCLSVCYSLFYVTVKPTQTYFLIEFFKPKTTAWYEKLFF